MKLLDNPFGIDTQYTFWQDYQIAYQISGIAGVEETHSRVMEEWGENPVAMAEVECALNWLLWLVAESSETDGRKLETLWITHRDKMLKKFKGEDVSTYIRITD